MTVVATPRIHGVDLLAVLLGGCWTALCLRLSLLQFETGHNLSFDLAIYARSLWGLAHGVPINSFRDQHALALHSHFILYALAPFTRFFTSAHVLLVLQAFSLGVGGLTLYWIAATRLRSRLSALAVAFAYYMNPLITNTALFDMHPKTLAVVPILLALHVLDRGSESSTSIAKAIALVVVAFACREETALCFWVVGVYWSLVLGRFRSGGMLAVFGAILFCAYEFLLRPWLGADFQSFDLHFGAGVSKGIDVQDGIYLIATLATFAFLPLLGLRFAVGALVPLALNMLSQFPGTNSLQSHYGFLIVPFFAMGAVAGLERLQDRTHVTHRVLIAMTSVVVALHILTSSAPGGRRFAGALYADTLASASARECIAAIPTDAPAFAPVFVAAHLSERPVVRSFFGAGQRVFELDYVLLESGPVPELETVIGYDAYIEKRREQDRTLREKHGYVEVARCEPFVVLGRPRRPLEGSPQGEPG